ncbi:MAG: hypothetical protein ACJ75H_14775, partial [Thermoanaerobaculia bacterium]
VKGALIGAGVGAVTQVVRGRNQGTEILKGAAVGGAVGAAVGAYGDYKQERDARYDDRYGRYDRYDDRYDRYDSRYDRDRYQSRDRRGYHRNSGYDRRYDRNYYDNGRAHRAGRHQRCNHR